MTLSDLELTNSSEHKTNVAKDYTERERESVFQTLLIKLIGVHIYA